MLPGPDGQPRLPDDDLVRQRFEAQAAQLGDEGDLLAATAKVEEREDPNALADFLDAYDADGDGSVTKAEWAQAEGNPAFFAALDTKGNGVLTRDELSRRLPPQMYQISTTETKVPLIRAVTAGAFAEGLQRRTAVKDYEFVAGRRVESIGLIMASDALTKIDAGLASPIRDLLAEHDNGAIFALEGVSPAISEEELSSRIGDMRLRPDLEGQNNPTTVVGLTPEGEGFSSLAVLVRPSAPAAVETTAGWRKFAETEKEVLESALMQEDSMVLTNFDATIAAEASGRAVVAIVLSCLAIVGYLWLRFGSIQWGLAAVLCLLHDVVIVVGLVAASGWLYKSVVGQALAIDSFKIDLAMVAAFLTVIGYSVNDTIVVFDRIRENRGKLTTISSSIINRSINQTLGRTLLTSGTTLIAVVIMYVWGGQGIHAFSFALLAGVLFGTYSSIAVASPLLMGFKKALVAKTVGLDVTESPAP
ncbi:MAG: protein translocase subunit SecF [Planctomycetota bacterium]